MGKFIKKFKNKDKNSLIKRGHNAKKAFIFLALFFVLFTPVITSASQGDIDALRRENAIHSQRILELRNQGRTLANETAILDAQIAAMNNEIRKSQLQVDILNTEINTINQKIKEHEQKISTLQENLGQLVKALYLEGQVSIVEIIIKSPSFSDFINRTEYLESINIGIQDAVTELDALNNELEKRKTEASTKRTELENIKGGQLIARSAVEERRAERNRLLSETRGSESAFRSIVAANDAEIERIEQDLRNKGGGGGGTPSEVPHFYQTAYSGFLNGTSSTIAAFGCGVASIAMVLSYLGYPQTPLSVANNSDFFNGSWGTTDLIQWNNISLATGGRFRTVGNNYSVNMTQANQWANEDWPFIIWIKDAFYFHRTRINHRGEIIRERVYFNHFVVITGTDSSGRWLMNDPVYGEGLLFRAHYPRNAIVQTNFIEKVW